MEKLQSEFEIIDFHTHPFINAESNICQHKDYFKMGVEETLCKMNELNISKICGAVTRVKRTKNNQEILGKMYEDNTEALKLKESFGGRYVVGYKVHPLFVTESIKEVDKMNNIGIKLIGELVPYLDSWDSYADKGLYAILDYAQNFDVVVNFHSSGYSYDEIDNLVKDFPRIKFVGAHPGEYADLIKHIERLKKFDNYYLDISGTGLFREGMLKRLINEVGADRILFGSDYPTCNMAMFVGGVVFDSLLTDSEKEKILSLNAKKLFNL